MKLSMVHLLLDLEEGCRTKCGYCAMSADSQAERREATLVDNPMIRYPLKMFMERIKNGVLERKGIERICMNTIFHPKTTETLLEVVSALRSVTDVPMTVSCVPVSKKVLLALKAAGVDIISVNYETATQELFDSIKGKGCGGPYRWDILTECIDNAIEIFGRSKVGSHLQLGLGETAKQALSHIQTQCDKGVFVSLFAFNPVKGTRLQDRARISHQDFHKIQLGSYLIRQGIKRVDDFTFNCALRLGRRRGGSSD